MDSIETVVVSFDATAHNWNSNVHTLQFKHLSIREFDFTEDKLLDKQSKKQYDYCFTFTCQRKSVSSLIFCLCVILSYSECVFTLLFGGAGQLKGFILEFSHTLQELASHSSHLQSSCWQVSKEKTTYRKKKYLEVIKCRCTTVSLVLAEFNEANL